MNPAHIHLMLNHVPLIAIPVALAFLLFSISTGNQATRKFSYFILMLSALVVIPVYLTGEPAEGVVEHMPGVTEAFIEPHEEAAEVALIINVLLGIASFFSFFISKDSIQKWAPKAIVLLSIVGIGALGYTAKLGGLVRHTELRDGFVAPAEGEKGVEGDSEKKNEAGEASEQHE